MSYYRRSLLWIGCAFYAFAAVSYADELSSSCDNRHCVAVVDIGSMGSRIHLFAYDVNAKQHPVHIDELYVKKIKPGLAGVALEQKAIDDYFTTLMSDFPEENIPIYVYATAGMRLLSSDAQEQYYTDIARWFATQPQWILQEARTISGVEEGVFGWLVLNYHLKTLTDTSKALVGLLEIGGASAQIAFPVQEFSNLDPKELVTLDIYGRHITLFTHSFLGLGANEVYLHSQERASCFPRGYPLSNGQLASGNARLCQAELGKMINEDYHVEAVTHSALDANIIHDWYTVSTISMMASQAPFEFYAGEFTAQNLLQQANSQLCQQDYQPLASQYPQNEFVLRNCLIASYFYGLLVHGYGFGSNQEVHYLPGYDSDWALGVVLNQSSIEPRILNDGRS